MVIQQSGINHSIYGTTPSSIPGLKLNGRIPYQSSNICSTTTNPSNGFNNNDRRSNSSQKTSSSTNGGTGGGRFSNGGTFRNGSSSFEEEEEFYEVDPGHHTHHYTMGNNNGSQLYHPSMGKLSSTAKFSTSSSNSNTCSNNNQLRSTTLLSTFNISNKTNSESSKLSTNGTHDLMLEEERVNFVSNEDYDKEASLLLEDGEGEEEEVDNEDDEEERSNKLRNIWSKFETGQVENIDSKTRHSREIKELKSEILKLKMSRRHDSLVSDQASQSILEQMEKERSQELEEIRQTRHNSSITLIEKFDNIDVEGEVKHDLVPEQDSEVLKETSEKRKAMMENFKKTLELGDSPTKTVLNQSEEELTHLDTHMKMMREKILNASLNAGLDNLKERSPVSLYDSNTDSKVEYVSEPRTELDPNIVKSSDNETSQIEKEMNLLKSEGSASASEVKKRFENLADTSPDSSKKQGLAYDEILALVKEGQERQRLENETSLDEFNQDSGSAFKEPVPITAIDTKEKIAKFKAIERGQDDKQPLTPKPPRELTPPREGEKVIYENEPITINNPNYISANSPYQQNQQPQTVGLDGTVINENKEEGTPKDNAKTLATYFESIPNTPQQVPKESPKVKKFTDPKIHVNNSDSSADVCFMCGQKIYVTEKMEFNDKPIHKTCFKCKTCNTPLRLEKYATHDNLLYCTPHFKQLYANEPGVTQAISSGKK